MFPLIWFISWKRVFLAQRWYVQWRRKWVFLNMVTASVHKTYTTLYTILKVISEFVITYMICVWAAVVVTNFNSSVSWIFWVKLNSGLINLISSFLLISRFFHSAVRAWKKKFLKNIVSGLDARYFIVLRTSSRIYVINCLEEVTERDVREIYHEKFYEINICLNNILINIFENLFIC